ncbi:MAG TPA: D-arabinose 5-phosphate isomerase [Gammaproteobacteria bacterium]|nr:D-arabinose 5-phosphate isomerase [Gammaproteobacteria bacterium]
MNKDNMLRLGRAVIEAEAEAVASLLTRINHDFNTACEIILACKGRIVVTGMGKSGHIGGKIAATLASTGTPAFFVHPGEASHGDLGMITPKDVVLALSYSGETHELLTIVPMIKQLGVPMIAMTGDPASGLGKAANVHLDVSVAKEACPLGLAPTSSTTATLAMGDALAVALLESRGFTEADFAKSHPGGTLGRRLLLHVKDIMHTGADIPVIHEHASVAEALMEMTQKGLGMTAITGPEDNLAGIFTDGDLRRALDKQINIHTTRIREVMTPNCITTTPMTLAAEALQLMENRKINALLVLDSNNQLCGALNLLGLLRAGIA